MILDRLCTGSFSRSVSFLLSQDAFVCPPCTLVDLKEQGACTPVLTFLTTVTNAPGWRLEGNSRGRAVDLLENGVYELLNTACLEGAQPYAAREMAKRACALFLSGTVVLDGTINCGPPSGGKSTMVTELCRLFGAKDRMVLIHASQYTGVLFVVPPSGVLLENVRAHFSRSPTGSNLSNTRAKELNDRVNTACKSAADKGRYGVAWICVEECDDLVGTALNKNAPKRAASFFQKFVRPILERGDKGPNGKLFLSLNGNFAGKALASEYGCDTTADEKQCRAECEKAVQLCTNQLVAPDKDKSRLSALGFLPFFPLLKEKLAVLLSKTLEKEFTSSVKSNCDIKYVTLEAGLLSDPHAWEYEPETGWRGMVKKVEAGVTDAASKISKAFRDLEQPPSSRILLKWNYEDQEV